MMFVSLNAEQMSQAKGVSMIVATRISTARRAYFKAACREIGNSTTKMPARTRRKICIPFMFRSRRN